MMNDKQLCSMIKDMSSLYIDNVVSEESRQAVEEHLAVCEKCRGYYSSLEAIEVMVNAEDDESIRYQRVARKIKRVRIAIAGGFILLLLLMVIVVTTVAQRVVISGNCMSPTVNDGEQYILNKWVYKFSEPERNDIVIYERDGVYHVSRIIGLPGERMKIVDGICYVNDTATEIAIEFTQDYIVSELQLDQDQFLIMADNVTEYPSSEKRVERKEIVGKAMITR